MRSRGFVYSMGAGARKSLVLFWTALFLCSLLLQYMSFAAPASVFAVHDDGVFELDGNAVDQATAGDDWENGTPGAADSLFIPGSVEKDGPDVTYFTTGGSKDEANTSDWRYSSTDVAPDKDELIDVFAASYDTAKGNVSGWSINNGTLEFTAASLAPGASSSVHIVSPTDAADCAMVSNTASVTAANDGSDQASASVTIDCPDLEVTKTANPAGPVNAGDTIGFDVKVKNIGVATAYDVSLTDTLPAGFNWPIKAPVTGWAIANGTLTFTAGELALGASSTVTIVADTDKADCGVVPNTASATASNEPSDALDNNEDSASVTINCPDLKVEKTADNGMISAGDTAAFTIVVTNLGPGTAYDATLQDVLPAGINWQVGNSTDCSITSGTLSCAFGDLANGATRTIHISGETTSRNCGLVSNIATVAADNEPSNKLANNTSSDDIKVDCADLELTKTADDASVSAGDQIGFTITVSNNGAGTAKGVTVSDTLPTDAGLSWSIDPANAAWTIVNGVLKYGPADLASGASISVHITSDTTAETCGNVDNTASVTTSNAGSDEDDSTVMVECPDVTISKTVDNSPILAGQAASFTITAWNAGPGIARDVGIHDTLPAGFAWQEDSVDCSITNGVLDCLVGDLNESDTFTVHLSAPTMVEDCGSIPNTATVEASNEPATATGNNEDSDTVVVQCAEISLVKTAGDAPDGDTLLLTTPGNVEFTYVVTNTSTATLINIELVDDNATPANTSDDVAVTCPKTTLAAGESMTCTVTLPVTGFGLRTNIAVVSGHPELSPEDTVQDDDDAKMNVPEPEVTPTARITPPPTSTLDGDQGADPGSGMLMLLGLAGVMLVAGYAIPVTAKARRKDRRT